LSWSVKQFDEEGAFVLAVLGLRRKSVDRAELLEALDAIFDDAEYESIAALKRI